MCHFESIENIFGVCFNNNKNNVSGFPSNRDATMNHWKWKSGNFERYIHNMVVHIFWYRPFFSFQMNLYNFFSWWVCVCFLSIDDGTWRQNAKTISIYFCVYYVSLSLGFLSSQKQKEKSVSTFIWLLLNRNKYSLEWRNASENNQLNNKQDGEKMNKKKARHLTFAYKCLFAMAL